MAWTGIEHFRMGRFDPPPPADEPEDSVVCYIYIYFCLRLNSVHLYFPLFIPLLLLIYSGDFSILPFLYQKYSFRSVLMFNNWFFPNGEWEKKIELCCLCICFGPWSCLVTL